MGLYEYIKKNCKFFSHHYKTYLNNGDDDFNNDYGKISSNARTPVHIQRYTVLEISTASDVNFPAISNCLFANNLIFLSHRKVFFANSITQRIGTKAYMR